MASARRSTRRPLFETGDDRYRWLNRVQAVAKGVLDGLALTYEVCEVR